MTDIGDTVALLVDMPFGGAPHSTIPRGLVGRVVGTFGGGVLHAAFDMTQGIPGAEYKLFRTISLFDGQYVPVAVTEFPPPLLPRPRRFGSEGVRRVGRQR